MEKQLLFGVEMLTSVRTCDMIFMLGHSARSALFRFLPKAKNKPEPRSDHTQDENHSVGMRQVCPQGLPAENDPWRFRQQSSRVISIQFWYLTSLFTSLSVGSDMGFKMASDKTCKLGGFLPMSVLALIVLGA